MNWHTEHHMYAGVPCYNLPHLAEEIKNDMPEPKNLVGAWKEMLLTWQIQKSNPKYAYDTPVPYTSKNTKNMQDYLVLQETLQETLLVITPQTLLVLLKHHLAESLQVII